MTLKKLHENRHLFSVLSTSKPPLRKAILKHGIDNDFINLISELCLNLIEGNVQLPEVVKQQAKQHCSIVRAMACKKKDKFLSGNVFFKRAVAFFTLLLPIIAGLVNSFL